MDNVAPHGKMDGYGTYTWPNGDQYQGQWREGKVHGNGTLTKPGGQVTVGYWENDKLIRVYSQYNQ